LTTKKPKIRTVEERYDKFLEKQRQKEAMKLKARQALSYRQRKLLEAEAAAAMRTKEEIS